MFWSYSCGLLAFFRYIILSINGIDTPVKPLNIPGLKVGYAGGLNPENVGEKLEYLMENVEGEFWIDMESGVRTDDRFDIDKCVSVLQTCHKILEG